MGHTNSPARTRTSVRDARGHHGLPKLSCAHLLVTDCNWQHREAADAAKMTAGTVSVCASLADGPTEHVSSIGGSSHHGNRWYMGSCAGGAPTTSKRCWSPHLLHRDHSSCMRWSHYMSAALAACRFATGAQQMRHWQSTGRACRGLPGGPAEGQWMESRTARRTCGSLRPSRDGVRVRPRWQREALHVRVDVFSAGTSRLPCPPSPRPRADTLHVPCAQVIFASCSPTIPAAAFD